MAQYADGAFITRFQNHIQKLEIFFALTQLQDLTVLLIAHAIHAVDVHTEKPRLNAFEQRQEIINMIVPMVQVVNNAYIGFFNLLKNLGLIKGRVLGKQVNYCIDPIKWKEFRTLMVDFLYQTPPEDISCDC